MVIAPKIGFEKSPDSVCWPFTLRRKPVFSQTSVYPSVCLSVSWVSMVNDNLCRSYPIKISKNPLPVRGTRSNVFGHNKGTPSPFSSENKISRFWHLRHIARTWSHLEMPTTGLNIPCGIGMLYRYRQQKTQARDVGNFFKHYSLFDIREQRVNVTTIGQMVMEPILIHYRRAMPFGNRKIYYRGSSQFSIVPIWIISPLWKSEIYLFRHYQKLKIPYFKGKSPFNFTKAEFHSKYFGLLWAKIY